MADATVDVPFHSEGIPGHALWHLAECRPRALWPRLPVRQRGNERHPELVRRHRLPGGVDTVYRTVRRSRQIWARSGWRTAQTIRAPRDVGPRPWPHLFGSAASSMPSTRGCCSAHKTRGERRLGGHAVSWSTHPELRLMMNQQAGETGMV